MIGWIIMPIGTIITLWIAFKHIHMIVTDGGFRADGTFVSWPAHKAAPLAEAFRRAVLRLFGRRGVLEDDRPFALGSPGIARGTPSRSTG